MLSSQFGSSASQGALMTEPHHSRFPDLVEVCFALTDGLQTPIVILKGILYILQEL